ncbi:MAG: sugar ABC transporter ATP-binding protein [Rhodospirillaceae bacterium]|nr:sugar ABC transporter ATP-binding protein [Rhodospirillaceae bacterium]
MNEVQPAIEVESLSKRFDATVALDDVSFSVGKGEVRALIGENGAGKSPLVKILSGLIRLDSGAVRVFGDSVTIGRPARAHRFGIHTAFQEMTLVDDLTVTQNMLLPYEPTPILGQIDGRKSRQLVARHFAELNLGNIDPGALVSELDISTRQKIEIAKAVSRRPRVLLLDEPTSTLSVSDVDWLGALIEKLSADNITIVFISHRMAEVRRFCDSLTVLRNGQHAGSFAVGDVSDADVVRLVIGRSLGAIYPEKENYRQEDAAGPALAGKSLSTSGQLRDASFQLWPGEVLGVGALQGMGQLELFESLFGVSGLRDGSVELNGQAVTLATPADAVRAGIGISMVPEDRKSEGLFLTLTGAANVSIPVIEKLATFGWIRRKVETAAVDEVLDRLNVHPRAHYKSVSSFSGGNQQKIAIAKWLLAHSKVLLMFDPTRGVDIGTKHEIYLLIRELAKEGNAVLFYSTEIPELVNVCDRVLVMYRGRVVKELLGDDISEEKIMIHALGGTETAAQHSGSEESRA